MDSFYKKSPSSSVRFEEIEHTADVALRVRGIDLKELIENAAYGMASILCEKKHLGRDVVEATVSIEADDREGLLVEWLNELVFLAEIKSFVFQHIVCEILSDCHLNAKVYGKTAEELKIHIKAVTYHNLKIVETQTGLEATVIFDI